LADANLVPSVGSIGESYDALAETINGLYKAEVYLAAAFAGKRFGGRICNAPLGGLVQ